MDKRVLRERMRKKQQQLRRRKMMKLASYILAVVLVVVFLVKGVILPVTKGISGKDADKPVKVEADADKTASAEVTENVENKDNVAVRMPLANTPHIARASDMTAGWHEDKNGKWYQNYDKTYYAGGMQEIDGKTYSFDSNGYIQTGWVSDGFDDRYFNDDGSYNPEKHKTRIALTFDDGPGKYTDQLLDCLEENNAHATFFMLGQNVGQWEATVQRMQDIGCEIGNHSWDHPEVTLEGLSDEGVAEQMQKTDDALMKACGQKATVARAPYGAAGEREFSITQKPFFMWSLDTLDWKTMNTDASVDAVMNGDLTDGSIILMHDIHEPSVQAALQIIPQLVEKGYKLMTVSELAEAKDVELQYTSYSSFWDSALASGEVSGYDGPLLSSDSDDESDISDGSSEDEEDYSDGSEEEYSDDYYDDESSEEY